MDGDSAAIADAERAAEEAKAALARAAEIINTRVRASAESWPLDLPASLHNALHFMTLAVEECSAKATELLIAAKEMHLTNVIRWNHRDYLQEIGEDAAKAYAAKREKAKIINEELRENRFAIQHPETKNPCILLAVTSHDKAGRYTLEERGTKKRSGSYKSLLELLPIKLMPDAPRKEGVIERRRKQEE